MTKITCPRCKGIRYVTVRLPKGERDFKTCPECKGVGFKLIAGAAC